MVGLLKAIAVMILTVVGGLFALLMILTMILAAGWIWMTWKEWHDEA
jgi:hypothetical protein